MAIDSTGFHMFMIFFGISSAIAASSWLISVFKLERR